VLVVDWADGKRILVEGQKGEFPRTLYPLRRLQLTKIKIALNRGARSGAVQKAWKENKVSEKWASTNVAKKLATKRQRADLNDFQRFSVMINRKQRAFAVRKLVSKQINPKKAAPKKAAGKK
jgi:large subunit ribosomal protein L14e